MLRNKIEAFSNTASISSIFRSGYESFFVTLLSALKSMQNLIFPFFLSANKMGEAQGVWPGEEGKGTRKTQQNGTEENGLFISTNRKGETNDL